MNGIKTASRQEASVKSLFKESPDRSSFGPIGFISPVSAGRLKGLIGYVGDGEGQNGRIAPIENYEHARFIGDVVREGISRLSEGGNTRLSIRTIVRDDALGIASEEAQATGATVEAVLQSGTGYSIMYIGYNLESRSLGAEHQGRHRELINAAVEAGQAQSALADLASDINANAHRYSTVIIGDGFRSFTDLEREQIHELLSAFGYDREGADSVIGNPNNIIGLVYESSGSGRSIVGISVTETRSIAMENGGALHIAELTDGIIAGEAAGHSLYSRLLSDVYRHIAENRPEISIIYAESNVASRGILRAAALQGRTFGGVLPNHAMISNREGRPELKSLVVTSLTREQALASVARLDEACEELQQAIRS